MRLYNLIISFKQLLEMPIKMRLFTRIKNWHILLADYFNFSRFGDYTVYFRKGGKMLLRLGTTDKWSVHEIVLRDDYKIRELPQGPSKIIDLGANAGVFSIYAALIHPMAKIYAYEPEKSNFAYLMKNIRLNGLSRTVLPFQFACFSTSGERKLFKGTDNRAYSLTKKIGKATTIIKTTTLQKIFKVNNIQTCDLLKIDIEGSEYDALYSLPKEIYRKISRISMEYHNRKDKTHTGTALKDFLIKHGYETNIEPSLDGIVGMIYATRRAV